VASLAFLPVVVKAVALAAFVLTAPGGAVLMWVRGLPASVVLALTPLAGLAVLLIASTASVLIGGLWHPTALLWLLIVGSLVSMVVARRREYRRTRFTLTAR
jgi:hypothetical protein